MNRGKRDFAHVLQNSQLSTSAGSNRKLGPQVRIATPKTKPRVRFENHHNPAPLGSKTPPNPLSGGSMPYCRARMRVTSNRYNLYHSPILAGVKLTVEVLRPT